MYNRIKKIIRMRLPISIRNDDREVPALACFKSSRSRCIDFVFTNHKHSFMQFKSFETGFSDNHHMIYTILKTTFIKLPPKKVIYRDYKNWSSMHFEDELRQNLVSAHPSVYFLLRRRSSLHLTVILLLMSAPCTLIFLKHLRECGMTV